MAKGKTLFKTIEKNGKKTTYQIDGIPEKQAAQLLKDSRYSESGKDTSKKPAKQEDEPKPKEPKKDESKVNREAPPPVNPTGSAGNASKTKPE